MESGSALEEFLNSDASGVIIVAKLPTDIQAHLGAKTTRVFLSSQTRDTHKKHKWSKEDFSYLQDLLDHGEIRADRNHHIIAAHFNGKWRYAAVKVTEDGKEIYLSSFHDMRKKQVIDFPNKGTLVRRGRSF